MKHYPQRNNNKKVNVVGDALLFLGKLSVAAACGLGALGMSGLPHYSDPARHPETALSSPMMPAAAAALVGFVVAQVSVRCSVVWVPVWARRGGRLVGDHRRNRINNNHNNNNRPTTPDQQPFHTTKDILRRLRARDRHGAAVVLRRLGVQRRAPAVCAPAAAGCDRRRRARRGGRWGAARREGEARRRWRRRADRWVGSLATRK